MRSRGTSGCWLSVFLTSVIMQLLHIPRVSHRPLCCVPQCHVVQCKHRMNQSWDVTDRQHFYRALQTAKPAVRHAPTATCHFTPNLFSMAMRAGTVWLAYA